MRKTATSVLLGLLFSTGLVGGLAGVASASTTTKVVADPGTGNIELCKTWTTPTISGVTLNTLAGEGFSFTIADGGSTQTVSVNAGTCSPEIPVAAGTATITEALEPWYQVTAITELPGQSYLGTPNLATQSVTATVTAGAGVDVVTYNNALVTGYVEVCKATPTGSGLTGTFGFALTAALPSGTYATAKYAGTASATVGACSSPIQVPAGTITATENGTNLYVTAISADLNGVPTVSELVGTPNLVTGTGVATVLASANVSTQTDISFTDDVVALKVCKAWEGTAGVAGQEYPFTITPVANADGQGPVPAPYTGSDQVGQCTTPVAYAPGTVVTITEGIVPGTKVNAIATTGAASTNLPYPDLINRTTVITVGNLTTGTSSTDEAIVTFTDQNALDGDLKICKYAGTGLAPLGTTFNFTVTGDGSYTVAVPLGQCEFVGGNTSPIEFPYNQTLTVTEAASTGNEAQSITADLANVTESRGATTEPVLTSLSLGSIGTTSSANVTISENLLTEVNFYDIDPPVVTAPSGNGSGVASSNGTTGAASNNNPLGTSNTSNAVVNANGVLVIVPTNAVSPITSASLTHVTLTKAQEAKLVKLQKQLASDKAQVKALSTKHFATKAAAKAAAKKISALKSQEKTLNKEINLLK